MIRWDSPHESAGSSLAGPQVLNSPLLSEIGVPHGFSTRQGGASRGVYASLNFGSPMDHQADDPAAVAANYRRFCQTLGVLRRQRVSVHQVHGSRVLVLGADDVDRYRILPGAEPQAKADGLVTARGDRLLVVRVADCAAVLLASEDGAVAAAVHAGWRGTVAAVVPRAVAAIERNFQIPADRLRAAIGPCIGSAAFEVGPEVADKFAEAGLSDAVIRWPGSAKPHVDLKAALTTQLVGCGLRHTMVEALGGCTFAEPDRYFSHRREAGHTGRMIAAIGPRASVHTVGPR